MSGFEIKSGIEIPQRERASRECKYPFATMSVGDMFEVPVIAEVGEDAALVYSRMANAIQSYRKTHKDVKFTPRKLENGNVGVWRIA